MSEIDALVKKLKKLLLESEDFDKISNTFYDLAEYDEFTSAGRPKNNPMLLALMQKMMEYLCKRPVAITKTVLIYNKKYKIYHGPFETKDRSGSLFYFKGLEKGMMMVYDYATGMTDYLRVTPTIVPGPVSPFVGTD
ncbi:MAG: hypothetical protein QNK37_25840 [Acidobacteriota bacterium]|nr:hypothetical protein [Acidobacteriota bacterium]